MKTWLLQKKLRDILAREKGYEKKSWGQTLAIGLAYPNYYRVGMSNLGFQTIYALLNNQPSTLCERVFLPDPPEEGDFTPGAPLLLSLESQRPLKDFDIIAFSISFEGDYPNILSMLSQAGITLETEKRMESEPLILGGGVAVTLNPEPLSPFFDLFLIGEGEEMLPEFLVRYRETRSEISRPALLFSLQRDMEGVYVPALYHQEKDGIAAGKLVPVYAELPSRIKKRWVSNLDAFNTQQGIMPASAEFMNMHLLEVNRGCPRGCRFCAAGYLYRPTRFRSLKTLKSALQDVLVEQTKVGLIGTAVSDYPGLCDLGRYIIAGQRQLALGSLRLDRLTGDMLDLIKAGGIETVALAPEAGTQRMRDVINKGITEDQIMQAVELFIQHEIFRIRLYFMVGLPTETGEDVEGIIELTKKIRYLALKSSGGRKRFSRITLSVNQFIPKPATPFQWHNLEDTNTVRLKLKKITSTLRREAGIKVTHDLPKWNYLQALFSLGDRQTGSLLLAAHRLKGNWSQAFRESPLNPDYYVYRLKDIGEILPWEIIDHGVSRDFLAQEYKKALAGWR